VWSSTKVGCDLDGKYLSSQKKNTSGANTLAYFGHQSAKKSSNIDRRPSNKSRYLEKVAEAVIKSVKKLELELAKLDLEQELS
jgi:hypothetical protein